MLSLVYKCKYFRKPNKAYLCDIVGSVTDHCNKAIKYHRKMSCNLFTCGASCL